MDSSIQQPKQSSFLPDYSTQTKYIQSHYGNCVYLHFRVEESDKTRSVNEAEKVTVYAYEGKRGLVQTADGRMGWVNTDYLVDSYSPYYQKLDDGCYLATIESVNKPGDMFYVATVKVLYADGDREINKEYRLCISEDVTIFNENGRYESDIKKLLENYSKEGVTATIESYNGKIVYVDTFFDW